VASEHDDLIPNRTSPSACPLREDTVRRSALLLVCLLSLATGLALLRTAEFLTVTAPPAVAQPDDRSADVVLARRFYAAVDTVLRTGDAAVLVPLIAPDLVEHPARIDGGTGRDGLAASLRALGADFPGLRLVVDDVQATGLDEVTARVRLVGTTTGSFLGLPVATEPATWGPLEVLRIADGRIVERWRSGREDAVLQPLAQTGPIADPDETTPRLVALTRLTFAARRSIAIATGGATRLLVVETGDLNVGARSATTGAVAIPVRTGKPAPFADGQSAELTAGDALVAPPGTRVDVANDGGTPATVLVATVFGAEWGHDPASVWTDATALSLAPGSGVTAEVLTAAALTLPPGATLAVGRATLASGAAVTVPAGDRAVLLAVTGGSVELVAGGGPVGVNRADGRTGTAGPPPAEKTALLAVGDGALVWPGTTATGRGAGGAPVAVTIVTVGSSAAGEPAAATPVP
jgi:predicted ester cyclase